MLSKQIAQRMNRVVAQQQVRQFSLWSFMEAAPPDPIFKVNDAFKSDKNPKKQLLGVGAYRCDNNKPYILESVIEAEKRIMNMDHEYAGIDGIQSFRENALKLAYGPNHVALQGKRIASCQSLSGTGSLRLGLDFLRDWYPNKKAKVYVADPTWPTHKGIAGRAGWEFESYRYYDKPNKAFDLNGMLEDLDKADDE